MQTSSRELVVKPVQMRLAFPAEAEISARSGVHLLSDRPQEQSGKARVGSPSIARLGERVDVDGVRVDGASLLVELAAVRISEEPLDARGARAAAIDDAEKLERLSGVVGVADDLPERAGSPFPALNAGERCEVGGGLRGSDPRAVLSLSCCRVLDRSDRPRRWERVTWRRAPA